MTTAVLELVEFEGGKDDRERFIRAESISSRRLLSHLLNGAGPCFLKSEMPAVEEMIRAHGWSYSVKHLE